MVIVGSGHLGAIGGAGEWCDCHSDVTGSVRWGRCRWLGVYGVSVFAWVAAVNELGCAV